ncbi:signal peptidase I [Natrarchaeobius chitinivorans]|uniref:Signal peptidase I n=1 Tax=Natrarchaeobius chitinivorans TaxID=1679083 RepID=A0A3N6LWM1_NATCH|nr:signal peptidase I [Natrarchaeobius chitinivorans]RQG92094.1 signal peptidase I [Natrarchaeobius chitinivorans]
MTARAYLERGVGLALAVVVVTLLVGQLLGQPILLGYVATGSMEPTMSAGDGFVAVPAAVSGDIEEGDVVVYDARELHDGGLTTHRVVEVTDDGYVTAGDANPFTDQDGPEPLVSDGQIVATAWQVNGEVVTVPHLGTVVMGIQGIVTTATDAVGQVLGLATDDGTENAGALLVGVGIAMLAFGTLFDQFGPTRRETRRSRRRANVIGFWVALGLVLLVLVTFATAAMVVPAGTSEYGVVSTDSPTDDPQVLAPGETGELTRVTDNAGYVPIVAVYEAQSSGIETDPNWQTVGVRDDAETTVSLTAPESTGEYTRHVGEYRYLAVLPPTLLVALHGVHPLVAIAAVNGVVVGVVSLLVIVLFGTGDFRIRTTGDHVPLSTRIERKLRKWR